MNIRKRTISYSRWL